MCSGEVELFMFSLSVFIISSSVKLLLSFSAFVQYLTFNNGLVDLT